MFCLLASPSWRAGPARAVALALAISVAWASWGCTTVTLGVAAWLPPEPGFAGIAVRVFDTSDDVKAGRLSRRPVESSLECADESYFDAFGSEWSLTDAPPGSCWLTVRYSPPGSPSNASQESVSARTLTLREGETVSVDVVMHRSSTGTVLLAATAVLFAVGIVVAMVAVGENDRSASSASHRPTEPLPAGVAAQPVPGGQIEP